MKVFAIRWWNAIEVSLLVSRTFWWYSRCLFIFEYIWCLCIFIICSLFVIFGDAYYSYFHGRASARFLGGLTVATGQNGSSWSSSLLQTLQQLGRRPLIKWWPSPSHHGHVLYHDTSWIYQFIIFLSMDGWTLLRDTMGFSFSTSPICDMCSHKPCTLRHFYSAATRTGGGYPINLFCDLACDI